MKAKPERKWKKLDPKRHGKSLRLMKSMREDSENRAIALLTVDSLWGSGLGRSEGKYIRPRVLRRAGFVKRNGKKKGVVARAFKEEIVQEQKGNFVRAWKTDS